MVRILETGSVKGQVQAEKIEILGHLVVLKTLLNLEVVLFVKIFT